MTAVRFALVYPTFTERLVLANPTFAWDMALATDIVFTQPVVYEFPLITSKTLLLIGNKANTAIGKAWAR